MTRLEKIIQAEEFVQNGQQIRLKNTNETFTIIAFSFNKTDMVYVCVGNQDKDEEGMGVPVDTFDQFYEII